MGYSTSGYFWKFPGVSTPPKKIFNNSPTPDEEKFNSTIREPPINDPNCRDCHGIKLFPHEQVLEVQRKHKITLLFPFFIDAIFIIIAIVLTAIFVNSLYQSALTYLWIALPIIAMSLSFIQIFAAYTFLHWFYQFYVVTNKRLIHVCFFRIGGFHLDEVFHEQANPLEIDSRPQNFIMDLLGIEDLFVYFSRFERPEPFIFKSPQNHTKIEEILENHSLEMERNE